MYRKFLVLAGLMALVGCTDEAGARKVLLDSGYTNVHVGGYDFFSCAKEDELHTHFEATSPRGTRVSGTVCCGLILKACTVRFEP